MPKYFILGLFLKKHLCALGLKITSAYAIPQHLHAFKNAHIHQALHNIYITIEYLNVNMTMN